MFSSGGLNPVQRWPGGPAIGAYSQFHDNVCVAHILFHNMSTLGTHPGQGSQLPPKKLSPYQTNRSLLSPGRSRSAFFLSQLVDDDSPIRAV